MDQQQPQTTNLRIQDDCFCGQYGQTNLLSSNRKYALYAEALPTNFLLGGFNNHSMDNTSFPACDGYGNPCSVGGIRKSDGGSGSSGNDLGYLRSFGSTASSLVSCSRHHHSRQEIDDEILLHHDHLHHHDECSEQHHPKSIMATTIDDESHDDYLKINPYHVLQVRRDATNHEIRQSYRRLSLWHHPGRNHHDTTLEENQRRLQVFEVLAACYELLINKEARRRYDAQLRFMEKSKNWMSSPGGNRNNNILIPIVSSGGMFVGGKPLFGKSESITSNDDSEKTNQEYPKPQQHVHPNENGSAAAMPKSLADEEDDSISVPGLYKSGSSAHSSSEVSSDDVAERRSYHNNNTDTNTNSNHDSEQMMILTLPSPTGTSKSNNTNRSEARSIFDSLVPVANSSSGSGSGEEKPEKHFTEVETQRLFGGPLSDIYRARNFEPFTDSFQVFENVFGSKLFNVSADDLGRLRTWKPSPVVVKREQRLTKPTTKSSSSSYNAAGLETTREVSDDKTRFVTKTSRVVQNRKLTRTETVTVDPKTFQRYSVVTVTSEEIPTSRQDDEQGDGRGHRHLGQNAGGGGGYDEDSSSSGANNSAWALFFQVFQIPNVGCGVANPFLWSIRGSDSEENGTGAGSSGSGSTNDPWCDVYALCHKISEEFGVPYNACTTGIWCQTTHSFDCHSLWFSTASTTVGEES